MRTHCPLCRSGLGHLCYSFCSAVPLVAPHIRIRIRCNFHAMAAPLSHQTQCLQCQKMCSDSAIVLCDLCRSACCSSKCRTKHRLDGASRSFCDKRHLLLSFYEANSMLLLMLARRLVIAPQKQAVAIRLCGDDGQGQLLDRPKWWPLSLEEYMETDPSKRVDHTTREGADTMRSRGYPEAFNVLVELGGIQENFDIDLAHSHAEGTIHGRRHLYLRNLPFELKDSDRLFVSVLDIQANQRDHAAWFALSIRRRIADGAGAPAGYITTASKAAAAGICLTLKANDLFYRDSMYASFREWVALVEQGYMTKDGRKIESERKATAAAEDKPPTAGGVEPLDAMAK